MRSFFGGLAACRLGGLAVALLALAPVGDLFVGFGNVRAGIVGIQPTSVTPSAAANTQGFKFRKTGLGGIKLTGIGLWSGAIRATGGNPLTLTLTQSSGTGTASFNRTFNVAVSVPAANTANTGTELAFSSSITLEASKLYTATITYGSSGLGDSSFYEIGAVANATNTYSVASTATNYLSGPVAGNKSNVALKLYYDSASIPEPSTMLLTGSALAARNVSRSLRPIF